MCPLPIENILPEVSEAIRDAGRAILQAPPGSGKTTRIPTVMMGLPSLRGQIVVVEPRRLAARRAAQYVASTRNENVGNTIGYEVRFESAVSPHTRIRYVTEGVFIRQLLADPLLSNVGIVILDEFHERSLQADLALAWLFHLQKTQRPDLAFLVMSATLDTASLQAYLAPCPLIETSGTLFHVTVDYFPDARDRPLHLQVAMALRSLVNANLVGDVLVFLPGASEIRKAQEACAPIARDFNLTLTALHGSLSAKEQDQALAPTPNPKVILSTNVAESSVTIDGITAVIDSGLARMASYAPWSGLPTLRLEPISKASAKQRAGRAGRTQPGRCLRLYSHADYERRPQNDAPQIRRTDLAEAALTLLGLGVADDDSFSWLEAPDANAWQAAKQLLEDLGATDTEGRLSPIGHRLIHLPIHPRLGRLVVEAESRGVLYQGATLAALVAEDGITSGRRSSFHASSIPDDCESSLDLMDLLHVYFEAADMNFSPSSWQRLGLDPRASRNVDKVSKQLLSRCRPSEKPALDVESQLRMCVLCGYPDRVARKIRDREVKLALGGTGMLDARVHTDSPEFMVAVEAEERREGKGRRLMIRRISQIETDWLVDLFPEHVKEVEEYRWNNEQECVETVNQWVYRGLVIDEARARAKPCDKASQVLADKAQSLGIHYFAPKDSLDSLMGRVAFLRETFADSSLPFLDEKDVLTCLRQSCEGRCCLGEVKDAGLLRALLSTFPIAEQRRLDELAPQSLRLPGGKQVDVHYDRGKPPWISSRLQDFFGMVDGPKVAAGRVPVVMHLLAPNHRQVQVTTDLAGFWDHHYPKLRIQLCRRYPKHAWPEDGRRAKPPSPGRLR